RRKNSSSRRRWCSVGWGFTQRQRGVKQTEPNRGTDLLTPSKHGDPNHRILHWIYSVTANQRNHKPPTRPGPTAAQLSLSEQERRNLMMMMMVYCHHQKASCQATMELMSFVS
ncbi:hypothetical protein ILYODFUR_011402, partial [Ilyodon furcidens]